MLWLKVAHLFFVISWMAAVFYLPRLFVYHAQATEDKAGNERFKVMERKLMAMMWFTMVPAVITGMALWMKYWTNSGGWIHAKMLCVVLLLGYMHWCAKTVRAFRADKNTRSHVFYRWMNEAPVLVLLAILILVVVKPF